MSEEVRIDLRKWGAVAALVAALGGAAMVLATVPMRLNAVEKRADAVEGRQASDHELLVRIEENQKRTLDRVEDLKAEIRRGK